LRPGNRSARQLSKTGPCCCGGHAQPADADVGHATVASIAPGKSATVTYDVTPPASATGGNGLVVNTTYGAPDNASGSVSSEQWVIAQKPLPLPPGSTDLALSATASASYTSPWTQVSAINNGIYPITSNDDNDLTPYWGDWPQVGTNSSDVYPCIRPALPRRVISLPAGDEQRHAGGWMRPPCARREALAAAVS
jgi:hypothetical protein